MIEGLYHSKLHEFIEVKDSIASIGTTDYTQQVLGNIVYADLPDVGDGLEAGDGFGAVESVKAASDPSTPANGIVIEVNEVLEDTPRLTNQDAFGAWIIEVELSDTNKLDNLMDAKRYEESCNK